MRVIIPSFIVVTEPKEKVKQLILNHCAELVNRAWQDGLCEAYGHTWETLEVVDPPYTKRCSACMLTVIA